jgi:hypothetical protein
LSVGRGVNTPLHSGEVYCYETSTIYGRGPWRIQDPPGVVAQVKKKKIYRPCDESIPLPRILAMWLEATVLQLGVEVISEEQDKEKIKNSSIQTSFPMGLPLLR